MATTQSILPQNSEGSSECKIKNDEANFVYNNTLYVGRFLLTDGTKSIILSQNAIEEFVFTDSIYSVDEIGAKARFILNVPKNFLESSSDGNENAKIEEMRKAMYRPAFLIDGTNGTSPNDTQPLNLATNNAGNILIRVDLYPVSINGEIFGNGTSDHKDRNMWVYSFLFSVKVIKDVPSFLNLENKKYEIEAEETQIHILKTRKPSDGGTIYPNSQPNPTGSSRSSYGDPPSNTLNTIRKIIVDPSNKGLDFKNHTNFPVLTSAHYLVKEYNTNWYYKDYFNRCVYYHNTKLGTVPFVNIVKLEKPNESYIDNIDGPIVPRNIRVEGLDFYFKKENIFKTGQNDGKLMLETFVLYKEVDCDKVTNPGDENTNFTEKNFGFTNNLLPGPHNIIKNEGYNLVKGDNKINEITSCISYNIQDLASSFPNKGTVGTINSDYFTPIYNKLIEETFGNMYTTSCTIVPNLDRPNLNHWDHYPTRYDCFSNHPINPIDEPLILSQDRLTYTSHSFNDDMNGKIPLDVFLKEGRSILQFPFVYGTLKIELVVDGLTLREPGTFFRMVVAGADTDNNEIDRQLIGYWFVISVESVFKNTKFVQKITAVKIYKEKSSQTASINYTSPANIEDTFSDPNKVLVS